jgi:hypothetical protein
MRWLPGSMRLGVRSRYSLAVKLTAASAFAAMVRLSYVLVWLRLSNCKHNL